MPGPVTSSAEQWIGPSALRSSSPSFLGRWPRLAWVRAFGPPVARCAQRRAELSTPVGIPGKCAGGFGVRGQVRAILLGDMSPRAKAATCLRPPKANAGPSRIPPRSRHRTLQTCHQQVARRAGLRWKGVEGFLGSFREGSRSIPGVSWATPRASRTMPRVSRMIPRASWNRSGQAPVHSRRVCLDPKNFWDDAGSLPGSFGERPERFGEAWAGDMAELVQQDVGSFPVPLGTASL